ncbi:MAG TPA: hypothetical protein VIV88_13865 [Gemmatimonadales bacterium]
MKTRVVLGVTLACTALPAIPARAQGDRWEREVRAQLRRAAGSFDRGVRGSFVATRIGMLNAAESDSLVLPLHAQTAYVVVAACDEDCSSLSLTLSDLKSHDLAVDRATDHAPAVRLTPVETASYRVRVVMETCQKNPCRYGVAVLTPPTP